MTTKQKLGWEKEFEEQFSYLEDACISNSGVTFGFRSIDPRIQLKQFISQLLTTQAKLIEEKLKHIAMIDNGKEPKYFVKDVLEILTELK